MSSWSLSLKSEPRAERRRPQADPSNAARWAGNSPWQPPRRKSDDRGVKKILVEGAQDCNPGALADLDPHRLHSLLDADLDHARFLFLGDHADVAAALEAGFLDAVGVGHAGAQAEGFFEIAGAEAVPSHLVLQDPAVLDQDVWTSLEDLAQPAGAEGDPGQELMGGYQHDGRGGGHQQGARPVDGAAEHRAQDEAEDHVEGRLPPEEAVVPDPQDGPAEEIDEESAKADLQSVDVLGLLPGAEEPLQSMPELIHLDLQSIPSSACVPLQRPSL